jgi:hypothetical protein
MSPNGDKVGLWGQGPHPAPQGSGGYGAAMATVGSVV